MGYKFRFRLNNELVEMYGMDLEYTATLVDNSYIVTYTADGVSESVEYNKDEVAAYLIDGEWIEIG